MCVGSCVRANEIYSARLSMKAENRRFEIKRLLLINTK